MSSLSIASYFPWSRVVVSGQSVGEQADLAVVDVRAEVQREVVLVSFAGGTFHLPRQNLLAQPGAHLSPYGIGVDRLAIVLVQRELDRRLALVSNFRQHAAAGSSPGAPPQPPES